MFFSALLGKPVDQSVSPSLFKYLADSKNLEYAHIKIEANNQKHLKKCLKSLQVLGFLGANITLPYKISINPFVDEFDVLAKMIGATNTIVFRDNKMIGYNTDAQGAISAIETKLKKINGDDKVFILGAGGAARAVVYGLYQKTKHIVIVNRSIGKAEKLANDFSNKKSLIKVQKLTQKNIIRNIKTSNIIINATSIGMVPDSNISLIDNNSWEEIGSLNNKLFFDVIFNPYKTKFLQDAEVRGAKICSGLYMMIYQAIATFKLWTGEEVSEKYIEEWAESLRKILEQ